MLSKLLIWKTQNGRKKRKKEEKMSALAWAISKRQWDLAALCLILGLLETLSKLPADSIEGLLDVIDGENGKG